MLHSNSTMTWPEGCRKAAHLAAFAPAFLLPWLSPSLGLLVGFALVLMNMFVLPWAAKGLYRYGEPGKGALEIILYPVAVMACIAAFGLGGTRAAPWGDMPDAPGYLAPMAAWYALAVVDSFMGLGCRLIRRGPVLPWNRRKPVFGVLLAALAILVFTFSLLLAMRSIGPASLRGIAERLLSQQSWPWVAFLLVVAAVVETAWFGIADNLVLPFSVCVILPFLPSPLVPWGHIEVTGSAFPLFAAALLVPAAFGWTAHVLRALSLGGAILGALLSFLLFSADFWLFACLCAFFALGVAATRFRFPSKSARQVAEGRDGRRGAAQVFGAMGTAAWMTPLVHLADARDLPEMRKAALLICLAPLVAKAMDTVSSEMGKALGGRAFSPFTLREVPPGTPGGISWAGTLWGLLAACLLALPALCLGWGGIPTVLGLVLIAVAANLFEAYWSGWSARQGITDGPQTNFLMTLVAALLAWFVWLG